MFKNSFVVLKDLVDPIRESVIGGIKIETFVRLRKANVRQAKLVISYRVKARVGRISDSVIRRMIKSQHVAQYVYAY